MSSFQRFARFVAVGGVATAIQYLILVGLVQLGIAGPVLASTVGFAISAGFNYLLNRRFTFESGRAHREAFPRFALVAGTGLAVNALVIWLLVSGLAVHYVLGQVGATAVTLVWNFTLNRFWTFPEELDRSDEYKERAQ